VTKGVAEIDRISRAQRDVFSARRAEITNHLNATAHQPRRGQDSHPGHPHSQGPHHRRRPSPLRMGRPDRHRRPRRRAGHPAAPGHRRRRRYRRAGRTRPAHRARHRVRPSPRPAGPGLHLPGRLTRPPVPNRHRLVPGPTRHRRPGRVDPDRGDPVQHRASPCRGGLACRRRRPPGRCRGRHRPRSRSGPGHHRTAQPQRRPGHHGPPPGRLGCRGRGGRRPGRDRDRHRDREDLRSRRRPRRLDRKRPVIPCRHRTGRQGRSRPAERHRDPSGTLAQLLVDLDRPGSLAECPPWWWWWWSTRPGWSGPASSTGASPTQPGPGPKSSSSATPASSRDRRRRRSGRPGPPARPGRAHPNRRQEQRWEREALDELRHGAVGTALAAYHRARRITLARTADTARQTLIDDW
jgi:hypothetical protein